MHTDKTTSTTSTRPLKAQYTLTQYIAASSLSIASVGAICGLGGMVAGKPALITGGLALASPALVCLTAAASVGEEITRRLSTAASNQEDVARAYRSGYREGCERATVETAAAVERVKEEQARQLEQTLTQTHQAHRRQLEQTVEEERATAASTLTKLKESHRRQLEEKEEEVRVLAGKVTRLEEEELRVQTLKNEISMKEAQLRHEIASINEVKIQIASQEGHYQAQAQALAEKEQAIHTLTMQIQTLTDEAQRSIEEQHAAGYSAGYGEAAAVASVEVEKLKAQCSRLRAELDRLNAYNALDRSLPTLESIVGAKSRPTLLCGSQGSGKALHAAALASIFTHGGGGVIPFVLDISEGGNTDSSWHRLGFPCTANRELFVRVLAAVKAKLDDPNSSLPFRNRRDEYAKAPAIVLIVDEVLTAFDGLPAAQIQTIIDCLRAIETRGDKRKVFCIVCGQDDQIQNLSISPDKGKAIKLFNTGVLRNYLRVHLNDSLISRATDEELKSNLGLKQYLNAFGGSHFVAAVEWIDGQGQHLKPFKHCSHHGHLLHENKPSKLPQVNIAPPPPWYPVEAQALSPQTTPNPQEENHTDTTPSPVETLERLYNQASTPTPTPPPPANPDISECPHCHTHARHKKHAKGKNGKPDRLKCVKCNRTFNKH